MDSKQENFFIQTLCILWLFIIVMEWSKFQFPRTGMKYKLLKWQVDTKVTNAHLVFFGYLY